MGEAHVHHWLCEDPTPGDPDRVPARCPGCGAERVFDNRLRPGAAEAPSHWHREPVTQRLWNEGIRV